MKAHAGASELDREVRLAAFEFLGQCLMRFGEVVPWQVLSNEFKFDGERVRVLTLIRDAYETMGGNVAAIERELKARGVGFSRKRIAKVIDQLGLERIKRGRG